MSDDDLQLIDEIKKHTHLYDRTLVDYKNQHKRQKSWMGISRALKRDVKDCKRRWKNIQDVYRRRRISCENSDKPIEPRGQWASYTTMYDKLNFLDANWRRQKEEAEPQQEPEFERILPDSDDFQNFDEPELIDINNLEPEPEPEPEEAAPKTTDQNLIDMMKEGTLQGGELVKVLLSLAKREEDSIDLFCRSMALSLKALKPELKIEGKLRLSQVLTELELRNARTAHDLV